MVIYVPDRTGRFSQRPHYRAEELDLECEEIICRFLHQAYGEVKFPVSTEDLTRLIERDTDDLDLYADLTGYGSDVEGVTEFRHGEKPRVKISAVLANDDRRENRLRTTLTHEYAHVHLHTYLWEAELPQQHLLPPERDASKKICKRQTMLNAPQTDWMEWQAGYACGALLMPVARVRHLVRKYQEDRGLFGALDHASEHGRELIQSVQLQFQVSADAAKVRLLKLGALGTAGAGSSLFSR